MATKPPKPSEPDQCGNCRFWKSDNDGNGSCRKNPPTLLYDPDEGVFSAHPPSSIEEWCGAHERTVH